MGAALDAVLHLADANAAQQQQQVDNFTTGINSFNQQVQNAKQNQLQQLQIRAGLAQNALQLNPDNSISYNGNLMNPYQQTMSKLQALSAAKQTGLPEVFDPIRKAILGGQGQPQTNITPQTYPMLTGQLNQMLSANQSQGASNYPNVAALTGTPNLNQMLTLGQSSTTDPLTGVTSTSQNQVNLPAQKMQATQSAQIPSQVEANKASIEAQTQADSGASDYKNIYNLASQVNKSGYLGNPVNTSLYKLSPKLAPEDVQTNISDLQTALKRSSQSSQIANTASLGEGVAKKISKDIGDIGQDSTLPQIKGWIKGNIRADYYKEIATKQFANELAQQGLNPNQVTPDQFGAGTMKYWGKLNPAQDKELQTRIMTTLAPSNAAGFGLKSEKYYDAQGKEIKQ